MKRIGIFGGSFDPVHNAHLALARIALEHLQLDELLWVPVGQPWQKARQLVRAADRAAMVQLAIRDEPRFRLESCELRRNGPSYTVDTVRELRARESGDWFLVIGQDQFAQFHTWHGWRELLGMVTLAVANRGAAFERRSQRGQRRGDRTAAVADPGFGDRRALARRAGPEHRRDGAARRGALY